MTVREYDLVLIGTGSGMNIVAPMLRHRAGVRVAIIDKDPPGGICLTRGCIPTKILLHSADVLRTAQDAKHFGVETGPVRADFTRVMERMRRMINEEIEQIRRGLESSPNIDYYPSRAEFVEPYTLSVSGEKIRSRTIVLCTGSRPFVPPIRGLERTGFHTSDSVLGWRELPARIGIIGGGYIAAEYGHFFSAMGSSVTIIGRNPRILPGEEPEVSEHAAEHMRLYLNLLTNHEVVGVDVGPKGEKLIHAVDRATGSTSSIAVDEILVATGRAPNTDILHPERGGVMTDRRGWILVNEYLETTAPGVWALGDAIGRYMFKHAANYESLVVYQNAVLGQRVKVDYRAVPHAVFTYPEIASVGMSEAEAVRALGRERVLIGRADYGETAKGLAMEASGCFGKIIAEAGAGRILGAHIIGPHASLLIQELVTLMYTQERSLAPIANGMHIHPALSEVVERAASSLMPVEMYHHILSHGASDTGKRHG
ncbi:MAG: dihydrolipoyl dehydrogenase [Thermoplasmata archaeon]